MKMEDGSANGNSGAGKVDCDDWRIGFGAATDGGIAHAHDPPPQHGMLLGGSGFLLGAAPSRCSGQSAGIWTTGASAEWQLPAPARCAHAIGPPPRLRRAARAHKNHLERRVRMFRIDRRIQRLLPAAEKFNTLPPQSRRMPMWCSADPTTSVGTNG